MMGSHSKQRSGRSIGDPAARWFASSAPAGAAETRARAVNCFQADWRPPYRKHEFSTRPICIRSLRCLLLQTVGQTLGFVGKMATQPFLPMLSPSSENFRFFDRTNWFNFDVKRQNCSVNLPGFWGSAYLGLKWASLKLKYGAKYLGWVN